MNRNSLDLLAVATLALAAPALALANIGGVPRALAAAALALALPGYAISAATFPPRTLGAAERLLCTLGLSLTTAALGGLALHWTRWALHATPWALLLAGITLAACGVALRRRIADCRLVLSLAEGLQIADWSARSSSGVAGQPQSIPLQHNVSLRQGLVLSLAGALVVGALILSYESALQQRSSGFTQLWLLPSTQAGSVQLGLRNLEPAALRYRIELEAAGQPLQTWEAIALEPGAEWQATAIPPTGTALEAVLYRLDVPDTAYRRVTLQP